MDRTGTLDLTQDLTLVGADAGATTLDGNDAVQVLRVGPGASVTLRDLTVRKGYGDIGGAIVNQGTLTLRGVGVTDSLGTTGGGIFNHQFCTVVLQTGSRLTGNRALGDGSGAAIFNGNGTVTIDADVVVCSNTPLDSQCEGGFSGTGACPAPSATCPPEQA